MKTDLVKKREEMQREIKAIVDDFNSENPDHYVYDLVLSSSSVDNLRNGKTEVIATGVKVKIMLR